MIVSHRRATPLLAAVALGLLALQALPAHAEKFNVTNLVSDGSVPAVTIDPSLINPWGMSSSPTSPFWVSDNNAGVSTLYNGSGTKIGLTVTIPSPPRTGGASAPTGQVFNGLSRPFKVTSGGKTGAAVFLFATEDGTIAGWAPSVDGTNAILAVDNSRERAVYKGLAIGHTDRANFLYAANFHSGDVEMYNSRFQLVKVLRDRPSRRDMRPSMCRTWATRSMSPTPCRTPTKRTTSPDQATAMSTPSASTEAS